MPKTLWKCEICGRLFSVRRQAEICESHRPERPPIEVGQVVTIRTWEGHETERRTVLGLELVKAEPPNIFAVGHEWKIRIADGPGGSVRLWDGDRLAELVGLDYIEGVKRDASFGDWYDAAGEEYWKLAQEYAWKQAEAWGRRIAELAGEGKAAEAGDAARAAVRWARRGGNDD